MSKHMTQAQFQTKASAFLYEEVLPLLKSKGEQYSNEAAFANFIEGAAINHLPPAKYLIVMATKHWHNLCKNPFRNVKERAIDRSSCTCCYLSS